MKRKLSVSWTSVLLKMTMRFWRCGMRTWPAALVSTSLCNLSCAHSRQHTPSVLLCTGHRLLYLILWFHLEIVDSPISRWLSFVHNQSPSLWVEVGLVRCHPEVDVDWSHNHAASCYCMYTCIVASHEHAAVSQDAPSASSQCFLMPG